MCLVIIIAGGSIDANDDDDDDDDYDDGESRRDRRLMDSVGIEVLVCFWDGATVDLIDVRFERVRL